MIDELVINAAVGTARKPPALPAGNPVLDEAFSCLAAVSPEAKLLGAVAILSRYEAAGRLPGPGAALPEPSASETRPPCSRRAAEQLAQVLAISNPTAKEQLTCEWLERCSQKSQRIPHRMLPALLDYGASHRAARRLVADVSGARGAWLMRLDPRWRFEAAETEDATSVWTTGTREQRIAAIARLRATNPAKAGQLIQSTWKEDAADDRAAFIASMRQSLGPDDETFLESCLDDRSKQVRAAAAELLARLPASAFVHRMIDRATLLLKLIPATRTGVLRKLAPASLEVSLPSDSFDPAWARDGISEKPTEKIGRRQWHLQQFLATIPPAHWSAAWNLSPDKCIDAVSGEFADVVLSGWNQAALRHPDPLWSVALLRAAAKEGRGPLTLELLSDLPDEPRNEVMSEIILSPRITLETIIQLMRVGTFGMDRRSAEALARQIESAALGKPDATYPYLVAQVLPLVALRIPPEMHDELAERWTGEQWAAGRKALDDFLSTLLMRLNIQREFDS